MPTTCPLAVATFVKALISLLLGVPLGWLLIVGFCSVPGLAFSVACGHNAYIWVVVFLPAGIVAVWLVLGVLHRRMRVSRGS